MSLVSLSTSDITPITRYGIYNWKTNKSSPDSYQINSKTIAQLKKEDTYMIVYNHQSQRKAEEMFNTIKEFNILYKAPMATNRNHGDQVNRNTLYIFEIK